jgi:serine/threonine protein phosphatase 1
LERAAETITDYLAERGASGHVVCLGDYVDRGPDSRGVVEFLMGAEREGALTCLKGNHEDMMFEAARYPIARGHWEDSGGKATLRSYVGDYEAIPDEHLAWMDALPTYTASHGHLFVHAGFFPGVALHEQEDQWLMWIRDRFLLAEKDFAGWPHIVHGHTPVHPRKRDPAQPELLSWRTNLDTGAFHTGVLTVGVFAEGRVGPVDLLRVTLDTPVAPAESQPSTEGRLDTPESTGEPA